jgi:hypothetical protein
MPGDTSLLRRFVCERDRRRRLLIPLVSLAAAISLVSAVSVRAHDKSSKSEKSDKKDKKDNSSTSTSSAKADFERQAKEYQRKMLEMERAAREAMKATEREMRKASEEQQRKAYEEQRRLIEEQQRKIAEEQRRMAAEQQRKIAEEQRRADKERERAERERKWADERQQRKDDKQAKRSKTEDDGKAVDDKSSETENDSASAGSGSSGWTKELAREQQRLSAERQRQLHYDDGRQARYKLQQREAAEKQKQDPKASKFADPGTAPQKDARDAARAERAARARADRAAVSFPGRDSGAEMPPDLFAASRREEFVVQDLSPQQIQDARKLGFELSEPVPLGRGGTAVQRLRAPGFSGAEAEREFHRALSGLSVTQNYPYSIFLGSLGEAGGPSRKPTAASPLPCPQSVCFGSQFIHWTDAAGVCTKSAKIGIIDTSFDTSHPAFAKLKFEQRSFLDGAEPSPYDWHGTAVLSLLAGDTSSGTPGLAPKASYYLASAFRSDAAGNASTDTVRLLSALAWLEDSGVDIVNMSFSGPQDPAVARAIERMSKKGIVLVAAAGNQGPIAPPSYPAAYPQVIAVTAVNRNGDNYPKANRGTHIDVSAPGVDVLTALPRAQQGLRTGTSFAAPFVTAIIASQGDIPFQGLKAALLGDLSTQDLGPPGRDPIYGAGLALASTSCRNKDGVAAHSVSARDPVPSWVTGTTLMRAGAGP